MTDRRLTVKLGEYQTATLQVPAPTDTDLRLAARLSNEPRLNVRWLIDGRVEVASSSWVGVVRFSSLDVVVEPKLVGGSLRVLRMLDYAAGVDMLRRLPTDRPLPADGTNLFELICLLLVKETEVLLRDGILRDYRPVDDTLDVLRGRLRPREQYLRRFGRLDQLECSFDEYDGDIVENQLLTAALLCARRRVTDRDLRFTLARYGAALSEVCTPGSRDAGWYEQSLDYNRRNSRYRVAHELCLIVLRGLALEDLFDTSSGNVNTFMLNMNTVFERFITRLAVEALGPTPIRVEAQRRLRAVILNDDTNRPYATIAPDLVLENPHDGRAVPIDIKYKTYDTKKVSTADIYQSFLYAFALGSGDAERRAGILYPSTSPVTNQLSISPIGEPTAARLLSIGLDIPAALEALNGPGHDTLMAQVRVLLGSIWETGQGEPGPSPFDTNQQVGPERHGTEPATASR